MVDHNMATEYDVNENSKSLVWQNLENFSSFPTLDEIGSINCEFSLNLSDEAENIHFDNAKWFKVLKKGREREIALFIVVELFRFIIYLWFVVFFVLLPFYF